MEEKISKLEKEYPALKFEKKNKTIFEDEEPGCYFEISGFKGNKDLILTIVDLNGYGVLTEVLKEDFEFTPDYFCVEYNDKIEIAISSVNPRTSLISRLRLKDNPVEIGLNFFKNTLDIKIQFKPPNSLVANLMELMRGIKTLVILTINGYKRSTHEGKESDIRNILNSVLFDLGYSYNLVFEPVNSNSLNIRIPHRRKNRTRVPTDKINIIYKRYIPELIEYFNIGEKVDYPPFRFICYFHIIEYFSDKSAYFHAAKKLKSLLLKPNFHININKYVNQAINFFKIESTKNTSDKLKIRRVIGQFIDKSDFQEYLKDIDVIDYFTQSCTIDCSKPLELPPIDFETNSKFEESLMKRIYSMRCSIVHSNPDFDETKAIPFSPTLENMEKLRREIDMIYEVARTIIVESSDN